MPKDAPGLAGAGGRTMTEVVLAEVDGVRRYLASERVPNLTIRLPALSSSAIGALHMTSMLAAAFAAGLRGIDAASSAGADQLRRAVEAEFGRPRS